MLDCWMSEFSEQEIGEFIVKKEGRYDSQGRLQVYNLPSGDGGGSYEVAGINIKYHPKKARALKALIVKGEHDKAKQEAIDYIIDYTKRVAPWHPDIRVQCYLRDMAFNRGPTGCAKIFQHALKTARSYAGSIDGKVGDKTKAAAKKHKAEDLLLRLVLSRQWYEREVIGRSERSKFWAGLVNRWIDAVQTCLEVGDPHNSKC